MLVALGLMAGCADAYEATIPAKPPQLVVVEIPLVPEAVQVISRATEESAIKDVNLYLFGKSHGLKFHFHTQSSVLRFECPPGKYDLYVVANMHADMGEKTPSELVAGMVTYSGSYADLPMSAISEIVVSATGDAVVKFPAIEVRRAVAKINYNIVVGKAVADIHLSSVRVYNIPRRGGLFGDAKPSTAPADYTTSAATTITDAARYSGMLYIPENCQGTVAGITTQQQKSRDNAPKQATYLMIRATRGGKVLDYTIYLGENNTDDFNVRRNTSHTLNITILGDNEVDTRIHSYTLDVYDDMEEIKCGDYCLIDAQRSLFINVEGNGAEMGLYGSIKITAGASGDVDFNQATGSYHEFDVWNLQGESYYELLYTPPVVTKENSRLAYAVTIWDDYDFWQTYDFEHQYANCVSAYVKAGSMNNGKGTISATGALYTEKISGSENLQAVCYENGCTLRATPAAGYKFSGWYSDSTFTKLLSTAAVYNFKPTSCFTSLYAKFEVDKSFVEILTNIWDVTFTCEKSYTTDQDRESFTVPYGSRCTITVDTDAPLFNGWYDTSSTTSRKLVSAERTYSFTATDDMTLILGYINSIRLDAAGTANCYIAQPSGGYKFYALTMGNGKATTGITPQRIYGSTAKVIWETGSTRGAVIKEAAYSPNNGLISFMMGGRQGNALIGLFDQNDVCVWSWHIWVTSDNPAAYGQSYMGGRTFMDRNLGALTNDVYSPSFRGLYYQWGRKDPFMYPINTNSQSRGAITYHPDYSYDITDPMMGYGEMTLAWAIAHPWMYMIGIYQNDDRENDTQNWITPQNPNLWGNSSTMYNIADGGSKSIYDPCPPGWRVPDRKAWAEAKLTYLDKNSSYCYNMKTGSTTISLPLSGKIFNGNIVFNGQECHLWTNAPYQYNQTTAYWKSYSTVLSILGSSANAMNGLTRENGLSVRCVKE